MTIDTKALRANYDSHGPPEEGRHEPECACNVVRGLCDRVEALEAALADALGLYTQADDSNTYERYRAACAVLEGKP